MIKVVGCFEYCFVFSNVGYVVEGVKDLSLRNMGNKIYSEWGGFVSCEFFYECFVLGWLKEVDNGLVFLC